jgi:hypothetical protein
VQSFQFEIQLKKLRNAQFPHFLLHSFVLYIEGNHREEKNDEFPQHFLNPGRIPVELESTRQTKEQEIQLDTVIELESFDVCG